jgi:hypothetical protein
MVAPSDKILEFRYYKGRSGPQNVCITTVEILFKQQQHYAKLPPPSVAGIEDPNIVVNVSKNCVVHATVRMAYAVKSEKIFKDFDNQMEAIKNVLLEYSATAKASLQYDLAVVSSKINETESTR